MFDKPLHLYCLSCFDQLTEGVVVLSEQSTSHFTQFTGGDRQKVQQTGALENLCFSLLLYFDLVSFVACFIITDQKH